MYHYTKKWYIKQFSYKNKKIVDLWTAYLSLSRGIYSVEVTCQKATVQSSIKSVTYLFLRPVILHVSSLGNYSSIYHFMDC
jgi:hypothetical protein